MQYLILKHEHRRCAPIGAYFYKESDILADWVRGREKGGRRRVNAKTLKIVLFRLVINYYCFISILTNLGEWGRIQAKFCNLG